VAAAMTTTCAAAEYHGGHCNQNTTVYAIGMNKLRLYIFAFWLSLLAVVPAAGLASVTSQQASDIARQQVPGRVLAIKQVQSQGRPVYQVKILNTRGEVHLILIDANSGKTIGRP